ncbi:BAR1 [Candida jiufengensis]|uniref:BAR1 n=1 Tax=Candida jiufengensis TaxID=497108 RepID=UPI0022255AC7|nr:BAR1 [Candida jiufengensis]KAI5954978.1 BAR1 [Candida jiufengensis]
MNNTLLLLSLIILCFANIINCSISFNFDIKTTTPPISQLTKRQVSTIFKNQKNVLLTKLGIGSNNDSVVVSIDTGSSDLWVMSNQVQCFNISEFHTIYSPNIPQIFNDLDESYSCKANGTFKFENSKSFVNENKDFTIAFADGSAAMGFWGNDNIVIDGNNKTTLNGLRFGIANKSSIDVGILGIGFKDDYDNFPVLLHEQGLIDKLQYSIYSNDADSGVVEFDKIDNSKYENNLVSVEIDNNLGVKISNAYYIEEEDGNLVPKSSDKETIIFDTGSTFSTLPREWIDRLGKSINGTYNEDEMAYEVNCDELNSDSLSNQYFNFTVNSTLFSVPTKDFIIKNERTNGKCYLGIMDESIIGGSIFGSDILKLFYLVYNLEDSILSIAPIKNSNSNSDSVAELDSSTVSSSSSSSSTTSSSKTSSYNGVNNIISGYYITLLTFILNFLL